jgi:hypothetical protein
MKRHDSPKLGRVKIYDAGQAMWSLLLPLSQKGQRRVGLLRLKL